MSNYKSKAPGFPVPPYVRIVVEANGVQYGQVLHIDSYLLTVPETLADVVRREFLRVFLGKKKPVLPEGVTLDD